MVPMLDHPEIASSEVVGQWQKSSHSELVPEQAGEIMGKSHLD